MSNWSALKDRVATKWQIPTLILSIGLLTLSVLRFRPDPAHDPVDETVQDMKAWVAAEMFDLAIEAGEIATSNPLRSEEELGPIHLELARARFGQALKAPVALSDVGHQVVGHYRVAVAAGELLEAIDFMRLGRSYEWQERYPTALDFYQRALDRGIDSPSDLRRHMISLMVHPMHEPAGRIDEALDSFIAELPPHRLDHLIWAIEQKIDIYESMDRLDELATLLSRHRASFVESDFADHFRYLEAYSFYKTGHYDDAELLLRTIRNDLEYYGDVHARTGWLLGRVVLHDDGPQRPQEAMSFFQDVVNHHHDTVWAEASRLGLAEAYAMLERHDQAIELYEAVTETLKAGRGGSLMNLPVVRTSLTVTAEALRQAGLLEPALRYAALAASLVDESDPVVATIILEQYGRLQNELAMSLDKQASSPGVSSDDVEDDEGKAARAALLARARGMYAAAGETQVRLSHLTALDPEDASAYFWRGAELFALADQPKRAANMYRSFANEYPDHPMVPRALLRVGQLRQQIGHLVTAVEAYQECYRRFPRTIDAARSLVPLAQCYLDMGPENVDLSEHALKIVLEQSELFTPDAPEYASAMFLMGDVLVRQGRDERAIGVLEEAIERYPEHDRVMSARFLLAGAYRHSALALKQEAEQSTFASEIEHMRRESQARFQRAASFYRQLVDEYEYRDPRTLDFADKLYLRHAYLYEADCLFETHAYRRALKLYEEAAANYKDSPTGLAAYVQIINCHVFLGEPTDARAALARALIVVERVPDDAFEASLSPQTRADWKRYFEWLQDAELF